MHVTFDETLPNLETSLEEDDDLCKNFRKNFMNNPLVQESPGTPHAGEDPSLIDGPPP